MSFTKSMVKATNLIANPKTSHNQLFLVGELAKDMKHPKGEFTPMKPLPVKGTEVIICKVTPKTTMGELNFEASLYSSLRVIAGTVAGKDDFKKEKNFAHKVATL